MQFIDVPITIDMLKHAREAEEEVRVNRTRASKIDSLTGLIGELAFAEWFLGSWEMHDVRNTKGRPDILDLIEVKTSTYPWSERLNLLVREDYAEKRHPDYYVQVIVDAPDRYVKDIQEGWNCRISGWATPEDVNKAPLRDFGSKGGYKCRYIPISNLNSMADFPSLKSLRPDTGATVL